MNTNDALELDEIMERHPLLHDGGYGKGAERPTAECRATLRSSVERFTAAKQWIEANFRPVKRIHPYRTSYGMKHIAEQEIGYITNGVFIAAMLACGYRMEERPGYNPHFNVSEAAVKAAERRVNP